MSEYQQKPEGVSVMVSWPTEILFTTHLLRGVAMSLAALDYPHAKLTGKVLYMGIDEFGEGGHEVVLEVES